MPRSLYIAALALVLSAPALAEPPRHDDDRYNPGGGISYGYADVLRSEPVFDYVRTSRPREECYDQRVQRRHDNTAGGTVIGAIVGGALGNTIGKGDGRKAATIGGAVVGGAIGHNVAKNNAHDYSTTETRCRVVDGGYEERQVVGYDVEYRFRGSVYQSRMSYDPGERLRIRVEVSPAE